MDLGFIGAYLRTFSSQDFEPIIGETRSKIEEMIRLDPFLFWGSMIPVIGTSFAAVRVVYGACVMGLACCEIINKMSTKRLLSQGENRTNLLDDLKKGAIPSLLYGAEQVAGGFLSASSIIGKISMIVWKVLIRPYTQHNIFTTTPTIDVEACLALWNRIKEHSVVHAMKNSWNELVARAFNHPVATM